VALFAISDLHLSFTVEKPMHIFGEIWEDHHLKIKENWEKVVGPEDTVILGGDLSWALKLEEAQQDLQFVHRLPGTKVLFKGNHDYWWQSYRKVKEMLPEDMHAVQNNYFPYEGNEGSIALCGARGWTLPGIEKFTAQDEKIYKRELIRLELSLASARSEGYENYIVTLHYPPLTPAGEESGFTVIMRKFGVRICIYGHLHGEDHGRAFTGEKGGIHYYFTSSDFLHFAPCRIDLQAAGLL